MKLGKVAREALLKAAEGNLYVEGNVLKVIDDEGDENFRKYLDSALERDKAARRRRLDVTKQIQQQNVELSLTEAQNEKLMIELREALEKAETAKHAAETSLDFLQKKTQFQLMGSIVKTALYVIIGVGVSTTAIYGVSVAVGSKEMEIIGHTWSSMLGILLTNSFSIIGTIMGVKYASGEKNEE
jgi:hypothetical protein